MDIISIVIILAVFAALLFALYRLGAKHVKFSKAFSSRGFRGYLRGRHPVAFRT